MKMLIGGACPIRRDERSRDLFIRGLNGPATRKELVGGGPAMSTVRAVGGVAEKRIEA